MKVLQINSVCGMGSTGKIVVQISDYLNQNNIENYIAYGLGKSDRPNTFKIGNYFDAHFHSFISRKLCMQGYGSKLTTLRLVSYIKKIKPDIVHLHNIHGHYLNFKILFNYLNKTNIQIVWTFHDCWPFTGKCTHYIETGCNKWMSHCKNCPQLKTYPDSERDRSAKNYIDKKKIFTESKNLYITTVSKWLKGEAEKSYLKDKKIRCIYNGVNTEIFKKTNGDIKKKLGISDKFMILGVSSVWNNSKGLDDFFKLSKMIDENTVIVLIGITPEQKKQLPDNIIGIRKTNNQQELAEYYSDADVLVNLSIGETFGLVVAEAMACGTPAIVYDSTACPEVPDGGCGFIVPPKDVDGILTCIEQVKKDGKGKYSDNAVKRVRDNFTEQKMTENFLELYKELNNTRKEE